MTKHTQGMHGQHAAEHYLSQKGLHILARNFRRRSGEIDLVARHGTYTVFVEVKYRTNTRYGLPRESVTATKQARIMRTAQLFLSYHHLHHTDIRFDVVEVLAHGGRLLVNHIENAFWRT